MIKKREGIHMFLVNVEGAVYRGDKWLIIERSAKEEHAGGLLSLVGGTTENESQSVDLLERTLIRELYEEVGVKVMDKLNYVRSTSFTIPNGNLVLDVVFLCEYRAGEPYPKSPDEVESVHWMTTEEIVNHPKAPIWLIDNIKAADSIKKLL
jgi:8-oxo-dGTP diphosphatase